METWEIVLILVLITIALIVLANHNVSLGFIEILDNSLFQLAIVGLTLAVAVASPAVGIVAIATIVIVYYVRNLIKVQLINVGSESPMVVEEESDGQEPRLIVEETRTVETTTKHIEVNPGSKPNYNTKKEDEDVVESALKEHDDRVTLNSGMFNRSFKIPAPAPVYAVKPMEQDDFPNPRSTEGFQADSTDPDAEVRGPAPPAGTPTYIPNLKNTFSEDSNIFTPKEPVPIGFNEPGAEPTARPYSYSDGQYGINQMRPYSKTEKYETADYIPGKDMGDNEFRPFGVSIDDKITNLRNSIPQSGAPPPNFDLIEPQPAFHPTR